MNIKLLSRTAETPANCDALPITFPEPPPVRKTYSHRRAILLISSDAALGLKLNNAAALSGASLVRMDGTADAVQAVRIVAPSGVLLDLDLPGGAGWHAADMLLEQPDGPPLVLLSGRNEQPDIGTAISAGSIIEKAADVRRILEAVRRSRAASAAERLNWNAIQRAVVRWLKPCVWSMPLPAPNRFWGINE
jgi:ActR/RegA family two-component response regulator